MGLPEVAIAAVPPDRLVPIIGAARADRLIALEQASRRLFAGRRVWNVNSTATGGGVAELLQVLLAYTLGAGVDTRWVVIEADAPFFAITKRLHNRLHGTRGDGGDLGPAEHDCYDGVMAGNGERLAEQVQPGDVVLLHDPQTVGLADRLRRLGAVVVWRCHVGSDAGNEWTQQGWRFLDRYLEAPQAYVFSRRAYVPPEMPDRPTAVIAPSIDPFSPKNQDLSVEGVQGILTRCGLIAGDAASRVPFTRRDGSEAMMTNRAEVVEETGPPPADAPLVVQVSRWDRLKDMQGVLEAFARHVAADQSCAEAHLTLAGPSVKGVADDPEGAAVLDECTQAWRALPPDVRSRIHLASLPMDDIEENAVMVNALQRHAAVVVQKSLVEGFGLTVSEAMWKSRPVVASAIGGILDQIVDGETGLLVRDPADGREFADKVKTVLADLDGAAVMGAAGRLRVIDRFLGDRHLAQYFDLLHPFLAP